MILLRRTAPVWGEYVSTISSSKRDRLAPVSLSTLTNRHRKEAKSCLTANYQIQSTGKEQRGIVRSRVQAVLMSPIIALLQWLYNCDACYAEMDHEHIDRSRLQKALRLYGPYAMPFEELSRDGVGEAIHSNSLPRRHAVLEKRPYGLPIYHPLTCLRPSALGWSG